MISFLDALSFVLEWCYALVFFWMLHMFLPLRQNLFLRIAAFGVCGFLSAIVIYSNDLSNLLGALLGLSIYITAFHLGYWAEKLTAVLVFYPAMIAVNYLMQDIGARIFFAVTNGPEEMSMGWTEETLLMSTAIHTMSLLLRLLFWVLLWQFLRKYLKQITWNLTTKMWLVVDALMLAPFIAIFTIIYFMPENPLIIYPICGASIFSSFGGIYLIAYICMSIQTSYHAQELEMKQLYHNERMDTEERVRAIYHDMKNHLLVLQRQMDCPETMEMIERLQQEVAEYEDYLHTGNDVLDIILKEKAETARRKHIEFSVTADLGGLGFIEALDISTIFGNGLDNAIEASEKLPEGEGAILVKAGRIQNFLSVLIENNCMEGSGAIQGGTTKKDDFLHGFGIPNIKRAVEKYDGRLTIKTENKKFTLKILIPIPK
ncbi:MAG: sensor histidine kinase [Firmicutes bacterium]|nr:sensor histidine kinase [Bacillota bacterium]